MTCETRDCAILECSLHNRIGWVGIDDIAPVFQEFCILDIRDLDLAANVFGSLPPLQLDDDFVAILVDHVFSDTVTGILDVHLDNDRAIAIKVPQKHPDPAIQFGRAYDLAVA